MSRFYLTFAEACIGWGLMFNRLADWAIARAYETLQP